MQVNGDQKLKYIFICYFIINYDYSTIVLKKKKRIKVSCHYTDQNLW